MRTSLPHTATVVLDTNVVVAALLWAGIPRNLLERIAGDSRLTLASSPALMAELTRVLAKPQLRDRVLLLGATTDQLVAKRHRAGCRGGVGDDPAEVARSRRDR